jgi:hypothetical protein
VDEAALTDNHAYMRRAAADGLEEDQIARLRILQINLSSHPVLVAHLSRYDKPVAREDVLDQPAAVKA